MIIPYLQGLGITDLYASPLLQARFGSPHGYDVINPGRINSEIGGEPAFHVMLDELVSRGMGFLLDIVPNHMAANSNNPWWMDILENGRDSPYAGYFDIDWESPYAGANRVLLPVLGDELDLVLARGELQLKMVDAGFFFDYYEHRFPLCLKSYAPILSCVLRQAGKKDVIEYEAQREARSILRRIEALPGLAFPSRAGRRNRALSQSSARRKLAWLIKTFPKAQNALEKAVTDINEEATGRGEAGMMKELLALQVYQLAYWRRAAREINYRRFFDISDLVGVRVEKPEVFHAVHDLVLGLAGKGLLSGLRIDHIDGLLDPLQYLRRLQLHLVSGEEDFADEQDFYVLVEKILGKDEDLPGNWPVYGTTGYEFISLVNGVLIDPSGMSGLTTAYHDFTGSSKSFEDVVFEKKRMVMHELFRGDVDHLGRRVVHLLREARTERLPTPLEMSAAITAVTAALSVYRTYIRTPRVSPRDRSFIEVALRRAREREPVLAWPIDCLGRVLLLDLPKGSSRRRVNEWLAVVMKWQQSTGPIMAKGYEDTALYCYNRLISLNEVGGEPDSHGISVERFHELNMVRQADWPHTLNTTATHDTKRGEDVRARLNVLSEISGEWREHLERWMEWHEPLVREVKGKPAPDRDMRMLLYQTMLGAWPMDGGQSDDFRSRLKDYAIKAAREAKTYTSWLDPDQEYEEALLAYLDAVLEDEDRPFVADFGEFQRRVSYYGMLNSLSGTVLKLTCPGVPDLYQGTELWDLSLVDPDNRRPVDFALRSRYLNDVRAYSQVPRNELVSELLENWQDGRVKMYIMYRLLQLRRERRNMFAEGNYLPVNIAGHMARNIIAFTRHRTGQWMLVVVPRLYTGLIGEGALPLGEAVWQDDLCLLPGTAPLSWRDVLTGHEVHARGRGIALAELLGRFPVAVLHGAE